ncbi:GRP family sugar transporter [Oenococcus oeni]|uniref:Glucose uptake permease n=11 Tax=Oenococcus oeni TaxID=1247 RepID=Q04DB3_OENOB|nr:GRP family sugar transporter [Oenococcus oeni]ABJ57559.1 Putative glucose uptake permease [Oenococcus oeni PSU-1]AWW98924.1 glucose transporter [Oenococcus oeni]EJN92530.1 putative glucose uptake permease [Oenococcus oeni AWRIB304]EJO00250.1 putative glucose uptake permease [Oenococcus oeni AWRIB419]EJO01000.1 putative glucose uptake permease [Oenococcus oeni AWRIB318]
MGILIALIPAITWGSTGLVNTKMGGSAAQQTLGMTFGALIFGLAVMLFYVIPNHISLDYRIWIVGLFSGIFWAVGTAGQFVAYKDMGVSSAFPLSTAGQIVSNAIMAAAVLGEWTTIQMWIFGAIAITLVTTGALLTSARSKASKSTSTQRPAAYSHGLIALLLSTIGYMLYFVFPNLMFKVGFISKAVHEANNGASYMTAIIGPQAIGQVIGAFIIVIFVFHESEKMFQKATWRNILTGLNWGVGNLFMFISTANPAIGQATATTLSQMGVIVGTFGGIYLLHEKKTRDQMVKIVIGSVLVVIGGVLISNLSKL